MKTIAIIACCDTKFHEVTFVRDKILQAGHRPLVIDISTGGSVPIPTDISREELVVSCGYTWEGVCASPKSEALSKMTKSICHVLPQLQAEKKIDGVLGMGGLQNTVLCSAAMQTLPLGFPKLIVSTIASGYRYFETVVGSKDITVMPSIVDFAGMNVIAEVILSNAAAAMIGMVQWAGGTIDTRDKRIIGTTLMGITNDTVMRAVEVLNNCGQEVLSFHSTGVGGRVMDQMIADGIITAAMDLTLHEMTPEFFGGYGYGKGSDNRLCAGAAKGIPMVVCPGGIDFICLRPDEQFKDAEKRGYVWHNSGLSHTKLYQHEVLTVAQTIVKRLNTSTGKVTVILPMGGLRTMSRPGELFHEPEMIEKIRKIFEENLKPEIALKCYDLNFMDEEFAQIAAQEMLNLL